MKRELSLFDLNSNNWNFPNRIKSDEDKTQFLQSLNKFSLTDFIDSVDSDPNFRYNERRKIAEAINEKDKLDRCRIYTYRLKQNTESFYRKKYSDICNIEKTWIDIRILTLCIEFEFRTLLNLVPIQKKDCLIVDLPFDLCSAIWQIAYFRYKEDIENYINRISDDYSQPNFDKLVKDPDNESEDIMRYSWKDISDDKHLSKGSSDGEAEFWRAVRNGDLDSIGF
jgi:hypothetical protein